jgi:DNA-binding response OmpR family regulator
MKILVIEDNPKITEIIALNLKSKWFEAEMLSTAYGKEGVELVKKEEPDIVLLDLMLPDIDGFQVLHDIRTFSDVLVVIVSARGEEDDRIRGLQEGADDYLVKPFSGNELVARLKALVRRKEKTETTAIIAEMSSASTKSRLIIDPISQKTSLGTGLLRIGPREYEILYLLVRNEGKPVSKQTLMREVFPENYETDTRFVEVYVRKLREALGENLDKPKMILDEGDGYRFAGSYSIMNEALKEIE